MSSPAATARKGVQSITEEPCLQHGTQAVTQGHATTSGGTPGRGFHEAQLEDWGGAGRTFSNSTFA